MLHIREERSSDIRAIDAVHRTAFADQTPDGEPVEVGLVHALRADPGWIPACSLVAGDENDTVLGHVVATAGALPGTSALGIGPLGVLPAHQGRGIGSALMHAVVERAEAAGASVVVLLGDRGFCRRFGFVPADRLGITAPDPAWGEHFQALALPSWRDGLGGPFRYAAPFDDLG